MGDIVVKQVLFDDSDLSILISRLDAELKDKYSEEDIFGIDFNDPFIHEIVFVLAYCNGIAVGCGALRPLDQTKTSIELKRFFVDPFYRQKRIASKILIYLEEEARNQEYSIIRLETGLLQPEAIAFYKRYGYQEIEPFGVYVDCEQSICFEKELKPLKRTLIISDIHGCYEQFGQLLELMNYNRAKDQLILLGDYVDRGMRSKDVVEQIIRMVRDDGVIALRGNHDQRFIHVTRSSEESLASTFIEYGGKQTVMSYLGIDNWDNTSVTKTLEKFRSVILERYEHHLSFLESLPYYHEDEAHIYVHAGLDPSYMNWKSQPPKEFMYIREPFIKYKTVVNKTVVFGHTNTVDIHESADIWFGGDKIGIDGGCSSGFQLNGLEVTEGITYGTYKV